MKMIRIIEKSSRPRAMLLSAILPVALVLWAALFFAGCVGVSAGAVGTAADTGVLTRVEMEEAAADMAVEMGEMLRTRGGGEIIDVFVALLGTRNDTSEMIDVEIFEYALVEDLRGEGVFTVRPEDRDAALEEMQFNISGLAEESLSLGSMKSPNFFIKTVLSENFYQRGSERIMEHTIRVELRSVETQLVEWSDSVTFTKKLARRNNDVAW